MFLAVIRARAVAAPLNPAYTKEEFEFYLSDSESKLLLTNPEGNHAAQAAAAKLRLPHATASLPGSSASVTVTSFCIISETGAEREPSPDISAVSNEPSDEALFLHTSGTTSRPKGVPLTQFNLAASVLNIKSVYRLTESDSTVLVLPLFHVHGLLAGLLSSLAAGASVALPAAGRFSASTFWLDMRAHGATWYTAVPTVHQILLDRHAAKPEPAYPRLRFIRSCSAALAPVILERLEWAFGAPVLESYAMTEASHMMASNPLPESGPHKAGSVGRPVGQEMAILDEDGVPQPAHVNGEVCIRGPNVTKGYKNNPEANKAAFRFGWFHTGDVGFLDADGYLHLVGRIKELINRGGEKISPIEVDDVLLSHPEVAQAVAFGVPDDKYGEEVRISFRPLLPRGRTTKRARLEMLRMTQKILHADAFSVNFCWQINCAVVPKEGVKLEEGDVVSFCRRNLAAFKVPKKVFVTDTLPRTATGKIQRRVVAEHFLSQISAAKVPKFGA